MKNEEFLKLKNSIARKDVVKILLYSLVCIIVFSVMVDGIYNDGIANYVYSINKEFYHMCVANKTIILGIVYVIIFSVISFIVIRNTNNYLMEVVLSIDQILKEPEKDIKLSNDLSLLEGKLNKIRIDLITSKNTAKEAEQKKSDLIMYMAHDLKTPLTSVIGYLSLLTQEKEISKELREKYMQIALDKSLRLEELTNQFFEITRYNLHDMPINKNKIDISILIDQLIDECYPMLQERKLNYKIEKPEHLMFYGDGDKLARAFGNLIKNAISYSYENTTIEIMVVETEEKIELVFKNKGDKIPKYKLDKIFDKFYRADESRTSKTGGTGLGLAITKEIIELHDGNIYVKNDDEFIEFHIEFFLI